MRAAILLPAVLFLWLGDFGEALGQESSSSVVSSTELPRHILNALRNHSFDGTDALSFQSMESKGFDANSVTNRISHTSTKTIDVWSMRQFQAGKTEDLHRVETWSHVAIVHEKKEGRDSWWYFEFEPEKVSVGSLPKIIAPRVDCTTCHVSGLRKIRPVEQLPGQTLTDWNLKIENTRYGNSRSILVAANGTTWQTGGKGPWWEEPLTQGICQDCHNGNRDSPRGILRRKHQGTISFLLDHGEMPPREEPRLAADEVDCMRQWFKGRTSGHCILSNHEKTAVPPETTPRLTMKVPHSFGSFQVSGFNIEVAPGCTSQGCTGQIDLTGITTGLGARDRKMNELLISKDTSIEFSLRGTPSDVVRHLTLKWKGQRITSNIDGVCTSEPIAMSCLLAPFTIDLRQFGLTMPRIFGASVDPVVTISGQFGVALSPNDLSN